jgi:hypothetical protein
VRVAAVMLRATRVMLRATGVMLRGIAVMLRGTAVMVVAGALTLGGCGAGGRAHARGTRPSALARAEATHEYPSPPPPRQTAARSSASATEAIRGFASAYINWDAQSVSARMRGLAAVSIGQARAAMTLAAAQTAGDYELQRGGIANHGTVEAVAPLPRRRDRYLVVTLESTSATNTTLYQGLRPAWHVAVATVSELRPGRWVVSAWQPEN